VPEHLPKVYVDFTDSFPDVAEAQGELARRIRERTPFDEMTNRLLKLSMAIGAEAEGAVRSNTRKALQHGASPDDLRALALLAITTCGFPTCVAALGWMQQVFDSGDAPDCPVART
jgi:4-carboxymuconolactone decarboxylase